MMTRVWWRAPATQRRGPDVYASTLTASALGGAWTHGDELTSLVCSFTPPQNAEPPCAARKRN